VELDSARWHAVREKALRRDGHKCQQCGRRDKLDVHHKKQKSIHPKLAYTLSNLVTLCEKCHMAWHKKHGFGKHSYQEVYDKYISHRTHCRIERRVGKINSRINYSKMKLTYKVVRGSKVSHNWRPKRHH